MLLSDFLYCVTHLRHSWGKKGSAPNTLSYPIVLDLSVYGIIRVVKLDQKFTPQGIFIAHFKLTRLTQTYRVDTTIEVCSMSQLIELISANSSSEILVKSFLSLLLSEQ